MSDLAGKVAIISGAARGQGRSHALRLASEGADIIALDICRDIDTMDYPNASSADLKETVALVEALDRRILPFEVDIRDAAAVKVAVDEGIAELGRVDIVLGNAGIVRLGNEEGVDRAQLWHDILETNLSGNFFVVDAALPAMIEAGRGGSIVLTGSTAGVRPTRNTSIGAMAYSASKWGLGGVCKHLATTLAEHSIRVNIVHPTGVLSGMTQNAAMEAMMQAAMADGGGALAEMQNALPVSILEPGDISDAVSFLVSDKAKWITGVSLPVDAGFSVR